MEYWFRCPDPVTADMDMAKEYKAKKAASGDRKN
jgi:hypothetical protein